MVNFTPRQKQLINRELKRGDSLVTKNFVTIAKRKGRYVELWKNKKTGKLEAMPTNADRLKFKLKVAQLR